MRCLLRQRGRGVSGVLIRMGVMGFLCLYVCVDLFANLPALEACELLTIMARISAYLFALCQNVTCCCLLGVNFAGCAWFVETE